MLFFDIVEVARRYNLILFADEVYRPLFHSPTSGFPRSVICFGYEKTVSTGSMSKAFSLAGIRVGWIASASREIVGACAAARDYTNISVSQIDDQVASYALAPNCVRSLLRRNMELARTNLSILDKFIHAHRDICTWVKPQAGTTAFVKFSRNGEPVEDVAFCEALQRKAGVMFCPGNLCFAEHNEWSGYVRIGYACETEELCQGLRELEVFLREHFASLPLAN